MTENTAPEQSTVSTLKNIYRRNERKILITITAVSITSSVLMRTGITQHNEFLKAHGLYNEFYGIKPEITA